MLFTDKQMAARALHAVLMALAPCGEASTKARGGVFAVVVRVAGGAASLRRRDARSAELIYLIEHFRK